jgi:hypothetical protein
MPDTAFGRDVIGHMPDVAGCSLEECDFEAAVGIQMHMQRRYRQVMMIMKLISEPVRQIAPGMVIDIDRRRYAGSFDALSAFQSQVSN